MFTQPTPDQIKEKFRTLPDDIKSAIADESVSYNLEQLGVKYKLRVDKVGDMIDEVGMVMLGFKKTADFIASLSKRLEIDRETAESLAVDIDNEVFKKIRDSLRTVQFAETKPGHAPVADPEYGDSPARDSLLQEVERHGNDLPTNQNPPVGFTSSSDYSADVFGLSTEVPTQSAPSPTPYEQTVISEEEKNDPTKTFKDHLEKKIESVKPVINADPYRESIE